MTTRTLIGLVVGVAALTVVSFVVCAPRAQEAQKARMEAATVVSSAQQETLHESVVESSVATSSTSFTLADIATHADSSSCWTVIHDNVYDLTPFIFQHPGGAQNIMKICGKDGTAAFTREHGNGNREQQALLEEFFIGTLE